MPDSGTSPDSTATFRSEDEHSSAGQTPTPDVVSTEDSERNPVDLLAEEFSKRLRNGDTPSIDEYVARLPEHEAVIRAMFPSIAMVERVERQERSDRSRAKQQKARLAIESVGDFRIVREIGRGGMGIVYEAVQQSLNRRVALKVLNAGVAGSPNQLRRFAREAEAAARLHHTNIVTVHGIGEEDGLHYFAMQLIDGIPLNRIIARTRRGGDVPTEQTSLAAESDWGRLTRVTGSPAADPALPEAPAASNETTGSAVEGATEDHSNAEGGTANGTDSTASVNTLVDSGHVSVEVSGSGAMIEMLSDAAIPIAPHRPLPAAADYFRTVARIGAQVAEALSYAHEHGVLHRDIKPSNLLLDREGTVWVTDFGLARQEDREGITNTGDILGTIRYMAPEQFNGDGDARSDLCSLGLTLFELLTLSPAYHEARHGALIKAKTTDSPPAPRTINAAIPSDLETIVIKACSTDPAHRYQSASDLAEDLHRFLQDRPILARRITPVERLWRWSRRNPTTALLSTASLLLLVAVAVVFAIGSYRTERALTDVEREYERAESNLRLHTQALNEARKQSRRAETNLALAVQAFEEIMRNISSRGAVQSLSIDLGDGQVAHPESAITPADAEMLETLLQFFDRFASENKTDLTAETARAMQHVGEIQQRLGRLRDAEYSQRQALDACSTLLDSNPLEVSLVVQQARILNSMAITASLNGDVELAAERSNDARARLEKALEIRRSRDVRFELARTLNRFSAMGSQSGPGTLFPEAGTEVPDEQLDQMRAATQQALDLLQELLDEDSTNPDYRLTIARTFRQQDRLARLDNNITEAREALGTASRYLQDLADDFPESPSYLSELADTLCTPVVDDDDLEANRLKQAVALCSELNSTWPNIPEYQALHGNALNRQSAVELRRQKMFPAYDAATRAMDIHLSLCRRYGEVTLYQVALAESLRQIAEIEVTQERHDDAVAHLDEALLYLREFSRQKPAAEVVQVLIKQLEARHEEIQAASRSSD